YRINGIRIHLPPLRERKEDIPLLCEYFIKSFCESNNIMVKKLTRKAMEILISYEWPGNVRELKSVLEKAVILSESEEIEEENLKNIIKTQEKKTLRKAREEFERMYILETLIKNGWKIEKTAKELGISRSQLFRKIRKLKINFNLR
ncbi:MAG: helix-turn-helix domain-containing protein, partial [candidate division WOR-3 bacterium]